MTAIARTGLGELAGSIEGGVAAFGAVPYAAPPVGPRRFAPPAPAAAWDGRRDAGRDGPIAPQGPSRLRAAMGDFTAPQDEDCLTLTIRTPAADGGRRPVLVWLHGGAWSSGAGSLAWYDGATLAREGDIVTVGVNYRLGALGYLRCPGVSPGNLGTLDQIAALAWVRDHIAAFGGDPGRVTVAGQSAGAATIGHLIADPAARPLFRRAILQSGGFGRSPLAAAEADAIGRDFLRRLDIDPEAADAAARLRGLPVPALLQAQAALARARARFADTTPPFMPVVDATAGPDGLAERIAAAAAGLDVLVGATRDEVHAFFAAAPEMADPPSEAVAERFRAVTGRAEAERDYAARRPGGRALDRLADLGSDHTFVRPAFRLADRMAAAGAAVHAYLFAWAPPASPFRACHCIELPFVFGTLGAWPGAGMLAGGDPAEMAALSAVVRRAWIGFVRDGDPSAGGLPWPAYESRDRRTMMLDRVCGVAGDPAGLGWRR